MHSLICSFAVSAYFSGHIPQRSRDRSGSWRDKTAVRFHSESLMACRSRQLTPIPQSAADTVTMWTFLFVLTTFAVPAAPLPSKSTRVAGVTGLFIKEMDITVQHGHNQYVLLLPLFSTRPQDIESSLRPIEYFRILRATANELSRPAQSHCSAPVPTPLRNQRRATSLYVLAISHLEFPNPTNAALIR